MLENMNEFRCLECNKLLFKYKLKGSLKVQVKCTRCGCITNLTIEREVKAND
ncbi:Com family DNA-binding transcriptional regulator [Clostridium sp. JN-9]|uniref:Com family DNA-binding transcriptional regulator n=1 Tax=Clostridium sp. JN-9 TaxID=2507159 RepID=UPI000FFE2D2C|nr:Com family DNA-binding transcriptional regulator [Clostridium sp. JN-9]QAT40869.1 Com family DNA-binding transcriptional regulator [Clostridium sp. JN-9]